MQKISSRHRRHEQKRNNDNHPSDNLGRLDFRKKEHTCQFSWKTIDIDNFLCIPAPNITFAHAPLTESG